MKQLLLAFLAAGVFAGCEKDTDEENSINLEGAWSQECRPEHNDEGTIEGYSMMRLEFNGGELSVIANQHGPTDSNCQTIEVETVFIGNYVTGGDADHETEVADASPLDLTMTSVKITPKTAEGTQHLNESTFCGKSDWTLDQPWQYYEAADCEDLSNEGPPPPGQKWHQIFKADNANVYFGKTDQTHSGATAETAPVELESEPFTRAL